MTANQCIIVVCHLLLVVVLYTFEVRGTDGVVYNNGLKRVAPFILTVNAKG